MKEFMFVKIEYNMKMGKGLPVFSPHPALYQALIIIGWSLSTRFCNEILCRRPVDIEDDLSSLLHL